MDRNNELRGEEAKLQLEEKKASEEISVTEEELKNVIEILENDDSIPSAIKNEIIRQMTITQGSFSIPVTDPLTKAFSEKLQPEHIDKFLDIAKMSEENQFKDRQSTKNNIIVCVLVGVALFVFLVLFLAKDNSELFMTLIRDTFAFIGGFGVGNIYNRIKKSQDE